MPVEEMRSMTEYKLWLGFKSDAEGKRTDERFEISTDLLRRHGGIFGSTGSGKTVLGKVILEEAAMQGIPVLAFDPQGDIASLMLPGDPKVLQSKGVPPARLKEYMDKVLVRVYTPASNKGLAISINPLSLPDEKADPDDMIRLLDNSARTLVKVLLKVAGLTSSWESKSFAAIYELIRTTWQNKVKIKGLGELADLLVADKQSLGVDLEPFMKQTERQKLAAAIRSLTVGSSQLLFREEGQLDFDQIIKPVNGKTPINILFLKTLRSEEEKHFFISIVLNQLYSWMLKQGFTEKPRLVIYQDEAAPFIPAGMRAPGPKEIYLLLFRQARKYGIECVISTQSPKDIDYKAFEQFNTIATGRISSEQSLKVLERILEPIAGEKESEAIIKALPGEEVGSFVFSCADMSPKVNHMTVRWLLTDHITLTEQDVQKRMASMVKEQQRLLEELEKARLEEEGRKEAERKAREEDKKKVLDAKAREEERRRQEEERRRLLDEKQTKFKSVKETDKVFATRGKLGSVSYDDIMNAFIARIEAVARTNFGLPFLKELVKARRFEYERAMSTYLKETKAAIAQGLAKKVVLPNEKTGKPEEYLSYEFDYVLQEVVKSTGILEPEYVDGNRLKKRFEEIVQKATISHLIERILLGKPYLQF